MDFKQKPTPEWEMRDDLLEDEFGVDDPEDDDVEDVAFDLHDDVDEY